MTLDTFLSWLKPCYRPYAIRINLILQAVWGCFNILCARHYGYYYYNNDTKLIQGEGMPNYSGVEGCPMRPSCAAAVPKADLHTF
jgi:hypothetical protein